MAYKIQTGTLDAMSKVPVLDGEQEEGKEIEERRLSRIAANESQLQLPVVPALLSFQHPNPNSILVFNRGDKVARFYKPHVVGTVEMILYPSTNGDAPNVWVLWPDKLNALPYCAKDLYIVHTNPLTKR
jgi:hypothetical protein